MHIYIYIFICMYIYEYELNHLNRQSRLNILFAHTLTQAEVSKQCYIYIILYIFYILHNILYILYIG